MSTNPESEKLAEAGGTEPLPVPRGGLIARHWRGDYSLARSYWRHGVLLFHFGINLFILVVLNIVLIAVPGPTAVVAIIVLAEVALLITAYVWALVGIWRAAGKYKGLRIWPILARVAIVFGILQSFANLAKMAEVTIDHLERRDHASSPSDSNLAKSVTPHD